MKPLDVFGYVTALSDIHTGSDDKAGNDSTHRSKPVILPTGRINLPYVTGNSIRGPLRRLIMADLLARVGYTPVDKSGQARLYHSLFSGGVLESVSEKDSGYIDLALKAQVRGILPPVALLGMAIRNQMLEGKLDVANFTPRCKELQAIPYMMAEDPAYPITASLKDLLYQTFHTRHDEMAQDAKEVGIGSSQMLYTLWAMPTGTVFQHQFTLRNPSEVEAACLGHMISLWNERPRVGAKASIGYGVVRLDYRNVPDPVPYLAFIEANKDDILKMLRVLERG